MLFFSYFCKPIGNLPCVLPQIGGYSCKYKLKKDAYQLHDHECILFMHMILP